MKEAGHKRSNTVSFHLHEVPRVLPVHSQIIELVMPEAGGGKNVV